MPPPASPSTASLTPKQAHVFAQETLRALHSNGLKHADLAAFLGKDRSSITRALKGNPQRLLPDLGRICQYLGLSETRMHAIMEERAPAPVDAWDHLMGAGADPAESALPSGCTLRLVRLKHEKAPPRHILLAPAKKEPRHQDPVWVQLTTGEELLRHWEIDPKSRSHVILTLPDQAPRIVRRSAISSVRIVIATMDKKGLP
jgi:transcriptional regulator with XRE-family HTH domain